MGLTEDQNALTELNEIQTRILVELSSMEGLSNKQLKDRLSMKAPNVSKALGELSDLGAVCTGNLRKTKAHKNYKETPYYISFNYPVESRKELQIFEAIIKKLLKKDQLALCLTLLESKYTNDLIEKYGFISIYRIIKKYNSHKGFNKDISQKLLHQPAFIKEIESYPDLINDQSLYTDEMITLNLDENNLIQLLRNFSPLDAIQFYRDTISNKYEKLFRNIHGDFFPESFKKFVDLDILLSPFTSYPVNDPIQLLFERPFERLYDDVYLIDECDYERFIQRAYILYINFVDILYATAKNFVFKRIDLIEDYEAKLMEQKGNTDLDLPNKEKYEALIYFNKEIKSLYHILESFESVLKASIFYWNIVSVRIDFLHEKMELYRKYNKKSSGKYRIYVEDGRIKIADLETNENILNSNEAIEIMGTYSLLNLSLNNCEDPFTHLHPCDMFYEAGLEVEIKTYEQLLEDLKHLYSGSNENTDLISQPSRPSTGL